MDVTLTQLVQEIIILVRQNEELRAQMKEIAKNITNVRKPDNKTLKE